MSYSTTWGNPPSLSLFSNKHDHWQFSIICKSIQKSPLTIHLNVADVICKAIAEYATGDVVNCHNHSCQEPLCILQQDFDVYHDINSILGIGYKHCPDTDTYFCSQCLELAVPASQLPIHPKCRMCEDAASRNCLCCNKLQFICTLDECNLCKQLIPKDCECDYRESFRCNNIDCSAISCYECCDTGCCVKCKQYFCITINGCCKPIDDDHEGFICKQCGDDTIIECKKCNAKCPLLFRSNHVLYGEEIDDKMIKCGNKTCSTYIHEDCCDEKEINGK